MCSERTGELKLVESSFPINHAIKTAENNLEQKIFMLTKVPENMNYF